MILEYNTYIVYMIHTKAVLRVPGEVLKIKLSCDFWHTIATRCEHRQWLIVNRPFSLIVLIPYFPCVVYLIGFQSGVLCAVFDLKQQIWQAFSCNKIRVTKGTLSHDLRLSFLLKNNNL